MVQGVLHKVLNVVRVKMIEFLKFQTIGQGCLHKQWSKEWEDIKEIAIIERS